MSLSRQNARDQLVVRVAQAPPETERASSAASTRPRRDFLSPRPFARGRKSSEDHTRDSIPGLKKLVPSAGLRPAETSQSFLFAFT